MTDGVRARVLGGFDVTLPGGHRAGPWERPAARRLVQLLLLSPGRQAGREQLAEALFPHLPPARASNAVSKALTMARAALHEGDPGAVPVLDADRTVIRLRPGVALDLDDLRERAEAALRLPPGPARTQALEPLRHASFALLPEERYADWVLPVRDALEQLHLQVITAYARECDPDDAADAWARLAAVEPTNEEACAALVRHHLAAGQRDRAIRTFHRCRAALLADLGVEPSPELAQLLADGAGAARPPGAAAVPADRAAVPVPLGREQLLARLVRTCVEPGRPRAVAVTGPAGIGKTTLTRALAGQLEARGWVTRHVTAAPDDRLAPYAGLRMLLQELMDGPSRARHRMLDAVLTAEAPTAAPTLQAARGRLAEELVALLDEVATAAPLAVVLDDAHWMDEAQRALVARVAAGRPGRWVLVVVARSDEPRAAVPELPLETPRSEVPPLVPDAMRDLVRTELADAPDDVVHELVGRSRGNAFFGLELARQWQLGGVSDARELRVPDRIVELLRRRIEVCSAPARQLVPVVALAGREATYELVLRAGAQRGLAGSTERCIRALDELAAAHLVVETPAGLRLLHPLLRDAALTTVNPIRRGALHRLLADALQDIDGDPLTVARHRLAAFAAARLLELAPAAAAAGFEAGRLARAVFANDAAMELLRGGLDAFSVVPRQQAEALRPQAVDAWVRIADIHLDDEDVTAAADAARVAIALARTDEERAAAWAKLAGVSYRTGDLAGFGTTLEEGLRSLDPGTSLPRARLVSDLGWCLHREGRRDEARRMLDEARVVLETAGDPVLLARCLDRLALSTAWHDPDEALVIADRALTTARCTGDESLEAVVLLHRGEILSMAGRTHDGLVDLDAASQRFVLARDRYMQSVVLWVRAVVLERHGDPAGALEARAAELVLLREVGNFRHLAESHQHRARLLTALGRSDDAAQEHALALDAARTSGDETVLARIEADAREPVVTGTVRER